MHLVDMCEDAGIPLDGFKGSSIHGRSMVKAFSQNGAYVTVLSPRIDNSTWADGSGVMLRQLDRQKISAAVPLNDKPSSYHYISAQLERVHVECPVDAVYERLSLWACGTSRWARKHGIPHWVEVNAPLVREAAIHRGLQYEVEASKVETEIIRHADLLLPVSPYLEKWLMKQGCEKSIIHVVPNGVNREWLKRENDMPSVNMRKETITIGFVGSLRTWHDLETLVNAMHSLPPEKFTLTIAGDGPLRDWLKRELGTKSLENRLK